MKQYFKIILNIVIVIIFMTCFSGCTNNDKTIKAIQLDLERVDRVIEPLDIIDCSQVKACIIYADGSKGLFVNASQDTAFSISSVKDNDKYIVTITHNSGIQASYEVTIKTVSELIIVQAPYRKVYSIQDSVHNLEDLTVRLRYTDNSISAPVKVMEHPGFMVSTYRKSHNNASFIISYENVSISVPALFLEGYNESSGIINIENVGFVTGPNSANADMLAQNGFSYTDLGISVYDKNNELNYFFYGDTFPALTPDGYGFSGTWHSNFFAVSSDTQLSNGITFDSVKGSVIEGNHQGNSPDLNGEVTKIPTGGTVIDGVVYMFYMSISDWSDWRIRWSGCVKYVNGEWQNVPSLNWVDINAEPYIDNHPAKISHPQEFDYTMTPTDCFKQITVCSNAEDGYLYLYATGNGRLTDAKLMRVKPIDFENPMRYEYFCGTQQGDPLWKTARQNGVEESVAVIDKNSTSKSIGELTVIYNPYLKKYMATYCADNYQSKFSNDYYGLLMRLSDTPYGPFDEIYCIDKKSRLIAKGGIYGAFTSEGMIEEDGRIVYLQVSSFTPTYNAQLIKVEFSPYM